MNQKRLLQIGNILTPILCVLAIAITSTGSGDIASVFQNSSYPKILGPAPITFAIWGPIFFFLALFYFYQARDLFRSEEIDMPYVHQVSFFFMLSTIATTAWFILWVNDLVWPAVAAMALYLLFSLIAYLRLNINLVQRPLREHLFVTVGWSLLTGWVTAATFVNTTTGLVSIGFATLGIDDAMWTVLVLGLALAIYLAVLVTRNDFVFAGVGVWVLLGQILALVSAATLQPLVLGVSVLGVIILLSAMVVWGIIQTRRGNITILARVRN